ncbi:MAG: AsmA family protein, partial [Pseudomonadota bacterium]
MTRPKRFVLYAGLGFAAVLLTVAIAGVLVFRSAWFHQKVRHRIVFEIEKSTGGRVEAGAYALNWEHLRATVTGLVVHGTESADRPPLFHAGSVTVGLRIVSLLNKDVNIALLSVDRPEIHIYVAADGTTNLPTPKVRASPKKNAVAQILALKIGEFALSNGVIEYDSRKIPLEVRGENLDAKFFYDAAGPRYRGEISSRKLQISSRGALPLEFEFNASLAVEKARVEVARARFRLPNSSVELSGVVTNSVAPRGDFDVKAALSLAELGHPLKLPIAAQGTVGFDGKASVSFTSQDYGLIGKVTGRGLGYRNGSIRIDGISVGANLQCAPDRIALSALQASALGATFTGHADLEKLTRFHVEGDLKDAPVRELAQLVLHRPFPWTGSASGPMKLSGSMGRAGVAAPAFEASLKITPRAGGIPIQGAVEVAYDPKAGTIHLGESRLSTDSTSIEVAGTLGETLRVAVQSKNLNDVLPAVALASGLSPNYANSAPPLPDGRGSVPVSESRPSRSGWNGYFVTGTKELPVTLHGGSAKFTGTVIGPLKNPDV